MLRRIQSPHINPTYNSTIPRNMMATDVAKGREIGGDHILWEVDNLGIDSAVEPDRSGVSNRYIANNATLQPVHEDLAETASVEALMDYGTITYQSARQMERY